MAEDETTTTDSGSTTSSGTQTEVTNLDTVVTALGVIAKNLLTINTTLTSLNGKMDTLHTDMDTLHDDVVTMKETMKTTIEAFDASVDDDSSTINTTFNTQAENILAKYDELIDKLDDIHTELICPDAYLPNKKSSLPNNKNFTYYLASMISMIVNGNDSSSSSSDSDSSDESSEDEETTSTDEEKETVDEAIEEASSTLMDEFTAYTYGVESQDRLTFQDQTTFEDSKEGQAMDFTRRFVTKFAADDATATEYVLLGADASSNVSTGSSGVERVKAWKDMKSVQTCVVIKNTKSDECKLYFPTKSKYNELEEETYSSEKKAFDAAVVLYQTALDDKFASVTVVPASSIETGCYQTEYLDKAKLITPTYEYN